MAAKGQAKSGGRKKGTPNRLSREVRELIREALDQEGGTRYLRKAARENPVAFLALVGKLLPQEFKGIVESDVVIHVNTGIEGSPGSRWADNCQAEQQRKAELGPGEPPLEGSDAAIELARGSVMEMEHLEPDPVNKPQPETWVPLRPDDNERPKVAQLD